MDSSYTRTGLSVLSNDGSDGVNAYRTSIRNLATWAEANAALRGQGLLSARPAAGKAGTFYKATDAATGVLYYDNGATWETVGASPPADGSAATPSLRTLGSGSVQAAAGNHTHSGLLTTVVVTKSLSTLRASTTTLANDPELALTLGAGTYRVLALLSAQGPAAADVEVAWDFTGTATLQIRGAAGPGRTEAATSDAESVNVAARPALSTATTYGTDGASASFIREELVLTVTGSGTLTLAWCQDVSNASPTFMNAGSTVIAQKLA